MSDLTKFIVVAEVASNHGGDMRLAKRYAVGARWAGCDEVKYQYYRAEELMPENDPRFEKVKAAQLSLEQLGVLKAHCENIGIGFLCTPFKTIERVEELASLGLHEVKIREADSQDVVMTRRAIDLFDRVFISTTKLPTDMFLLYHPHIKWLYTVPKYPAKPEEVDLSAFKVFDGFSCHVPNIAVPLAATAVALVSEREEFWVEVHVTLSHNENNLDKEVSLDFSELSRLVGYLRTIEKMKHREIY